MQIGQLNHLNFPKSSNQPLAANTGDDSTTGANGTAASGLGATVRTLTPAQDAPGVVLKLQSGPDKAQGLALAKGLVYSNGRKAADASDANSDTARMAQQHSEALQRSAGNTTKLTVDKDGVLVAGASAAANPQPTDFVSFAVGAMRDYANEQERLKSATQLGDGASAGSILPRSLAEVHKLASRFKLFA